jgi:hypothetical protein
MVDSRARIGAIEKEFDHATEINVVRNLHCRDPVGGALSG